MVEREGEPEPESVSDDTPRPEYDLRGAQGVMIGDGNVQYNYHREQLARSHYYAEVRAMAPPVLLDRGADIAELRDFCTRSDAGGYQLWQADAWAGKTALLASFVCNPPEGTRIVSFFITDRRGPQSNREAFFDIVIEQLAEILNKPMPGNATPATRSGQFLDLLEAAVGVLAKQGRRLVLLVDGLDNDTGSAEYSIAALLPPQPPGGLRIIASVRPDPPLPDDVPDDHPLRDPGIVRTLAPSPHARVIRGEALRDVKRLLGGDDPAGRDLLGLVVASEGGLSGRDLRELTGHSFERIERALETVTGRAFARRDARWTDAATPQDLYILAHDELRQIAVTRLEGAPLAEYRAKLHAWADGYRAQHWPLRTPEYLLRDYFRVMHSEGDLPRMLEYALDDARQDRLLDLSDGDVTALDEIVTTQSAAAEQAVPDLCGLILLGTRLSDINLRNAKLSMGLPAVWARLGRSARADTMVRSMSGRGSQLSAWGEILQVLADQGDDDGVRALLADAVPQAIDAAGADAASAVERIVAKLATADPVIGALPQDREAKVRVMVRVLAEIARMWGALGAFGAATSLAQQVGKLALGILPGDAEQAESPNESTAHENAKLLHEVATAWHAARDQRTAQVAADHIVRIAQNMPLSNSLGASYLVWVVQEALKARVEIGDLARAEPLIEALYREDRRRRPDDNTVGSGFWIAVAATAWIRSGQISRAEELVAKIVDPDLDEQCRARIHVYAAAVPAWRKAGDLDRARAAAREVEELARSIGWPRDRVEPLVTAASAWIDADDEQRAQALAREAQRAAANLSDMPKVSFMMATATSAESAAAVRADSQRSLVGRDCPQDAADLVLRAAAPAAVRAGAQERAADFGRAITHPPSRAWAELAVRRIAAVDDGGREDPFEQLVASVLTSDDTDWRIEDHLWGMTSSRYNLPAVEDFVRTVIGQTLDAWEVLAEIETAGASDLELCHSLADRAELLSRHIPMLDFAAQASSAETHLLQRATSGDRSRFEALIRAVLSPRADAWGLSAAVRGAAVSGLISIGRHPALAGVSCVLKVRLLAAVAGVRGQVGDSLHASETAREAEKIARSAATATTRTAAMAAAAAAWQRAGDRYHARVLAREIEDGAPGLDKSVERAWAFADASRAWVWVGDLERAESALASIADSEVRTAAVLDLAAYVEPERADALIANELRRSETAWEAAMYQLISVRPTLLVDAAGKLLTERAG
jgi:hypothetical protein